MTVRKQKLQQNLESITKYDIDLPSLQKTVFLTQNKVPSPVPITFDLKAINEHIEHREYDMVEQDFEQFYH